jgi:hypothetical protein
MLRGKVCGFVSVFCEFHNQTYHVSTTTSKLISTITICLCRVFLTRSLIGFYFAANRSKQEQVVQPSLCGNWDVLYLTLRVYWSRKGQRYLRLSIHRRHFDLIMDVNKCKDSSTNWSTETEWPTLTHRATPIRQGSFPPFSASCACVRAISLATSISC